MEMVRLCWIFMERVINLGLVALMFRRSLVVSHGAQVEAWIEGVVVRFGLWIFFFFVVWVVVRFGRGLWVFFSFSSCCVWW